MSKPLYVLANGIQKQLVVAVHFTRWLCPWLQAPVHPSTSAECFLYCVMQYDFMKGTELSSLEIPVGIAFASQSSVLPPPPPMPDKGYFCKREASLQSSLPVLDRCSGGLLQSL